MEFRIADTFSDSLSRLTGDEQKAAKETAFDLQLDPSRPGLSFHRLDKAKDKNFWSVRVNDDLRLIVHRGGAALLLCYVDHHDKAYDWAERRKLETHPKTGAAQLVEIRETVKEIIVPVYVTAEVIEEPKAKPDGDSRALFADVSEDDLLSYGVPEEWLKDVRQATEDSLLVLADHLPAEAAEALLELATGGTPHVTKPQVATGNPFDHPDAKRRFRTMTNVEELKRALEYPWEKWTIYLHPEQQQIIERDYNGPARVAGSAGTGKTIVALHRAVHLARTYPAARVLLTTFTDTLANALKARLIRLIASDPLLGERIDVYSLNAIGTRLYESQVRKAAIASRKVTGEIIEAASAEVDGHKFTRHFLLTEWEQVVDAWQLKTWEEYREVARLGRKTRLPEAQRAILWSIFERVRQELKKRRLITRAELFGELAAAISAKGRVVFDFVVADEAQDLTVAHLRFLAALGRGRENSLFFSGDLGQRIFQQPFSWKALGVDVRGRSRTLRVNYRTSHQIRMQADRLLGPVMTDVDGNSEDRSGTVSVFNGPAPQMRSFRDERDEIDGVSAWLGEQSRSGVLPHELGLFVRSEAQLDRARAAVESAGIPFRILDNRVETTSGHVSVSTMPLAKGLEFKAVVVMACDDEVVPLQARIESVGDEADLEEVYNTERHLLYVACTRARDHLLVTGVEPVSEFLDDMR